MIIKDKFDKFCIKTYIVTLHLNCLFEMVQMRGHIIWFCGEIRKIIIKYPLLSRALQFLNLNSLRNKRIWETVQALTKLLNEQSGLGLYGSLNHFCPSVFSCYSI